MTGSMRMSEENRFGLCIAARALLSKHVNDNAVSGKLNAQHTWCTDWQWPVRTAQVMEQARTGEGGLYRVVSGPRHHQTALAGQPSPAQVLHRPAFAIRTLSQRRMVLKVFICIQLFHLSHLPQIRSTRPLPMKPLLCFFGSLSPPGLRRMRPIPLSVATHHQTQNAAHL